MPEDHSITITRAQFERLLSLDGTKVSIRCEKDFDYGYSLGHDRIDLSWEDDGCNCSGRFELHNDLNICDGCIRLYCPDNDQSINLHVFVRAVYTIEEIING